jgi:hypothetical protein
VKIIFDHNIPWQLRSFLEPHAVSTAKEMLWDRLKNGDLLRAAQAEGFEAMISADQSIFYQQNNALRQIPLIVLDTNDWGMIRPQSPAILEALTRCRKGSYEYIRVRPLKRPGRSKL